MTDSNTTCKVCDNTGIEGVTPEDGFDECPDCGAEVRQQEGCNLCPVCGWSKCA